MLKEREQGPLNADQAAPKLKRKLPLRSVYYLGKKVVKVNRGGAAIRAVSRCTEHMRRNDYDATVAEVYDTRNGKLHAVLRRNVQGHTRILYQAKYDPKEEL
jgi:hypothetical protein